MQTTEHFCSRAVIASLLFAVCSRGVICARHMAVMGALVSLRTESGGPAWGPLMCARLGSPRCHLLTFYTYSRHTNAPFSANVHPGWFKFELLRSSNLYVIVPLRNVCLKLSCRGSPSSWFVLHFSTLGSVVMQNLATGSFRSVSFFFPVLQHYHFTFASPEAPSNKRALLNSPLTS